MSMSYAANKLRVPPGFEHLLEGLTREILREQPKNLLEFAAEYFRKKLRERDGEAAESALLSAGEQTQSTQLPQRTKEDPSSEPVPSSETPSTVTGPEDTSRVPVVTEDVEKVTGEQIEEMEQEAEGTGAEEGGKESEGVGGGDESELEGVSSGGALGNEYGEAGEEKEEGEGKGAKEQEQGEGETTEVEEKEGGTEQSTDVDMEAGQSSEKLPDEVDSEVDPTSDTVAEQPISSVSQQELSDVGSVGVEEGEGEREEREAEEGEREGKVTEQEAEDTVKDLTD